jgi:RNA polymerase sigma-70 factor (ECF subfamily)
MRPAERSGYAMSSLDQTAVERCFRLHEAILIRWLAKRLGERDAAQDVAQRTFLKVWRFAAANRVNNPKRLIFTTAARLVLDERRRKSRFSLNYTLLSDVPDERLLDHSRDPGANVEDATGDRQLVRIALRAIDNLPKNSKRAFELHRFEGLSYQAIADRMNVSKSSVEKYIIEALKQIRASVATGAEA